MPILHQAGRHLLLVPAIAVLAVACGKGSDGATDVGEPGAWIDERVPALPASSG